MFYRASNLSLEASHILSALQKSASQLKVSELCTFSPSSLFTEELLTPYIKENFLRYARDAIQAFHSSGEKDLHATLNPDTQQITLVKHRLLPYQETVVLKIMEQLKNIDFEDIPQKILECYESQFKYLYPEYFAPLQASITEALHRMNVKGSHSIMEALNRERLLLHSDFRHFH